MKLQNSKKKPLKTGWKYIQKKYTIKVCEVSNYKYNRQVKSLDQNIIF